DQGDPARQAVQAVDEVQAVDHAHDPDHGENDPDHLRELDVARPERVADVGHDDPGPHRDPGQEQLAQELPARPQVVPIVERADDRGDQGSEEQPGDVRVGERLRDVDAGQPAAGEGESATDHQEGNHDRDAPAARERLLVHAPGVRMVEDPVLADVADDPRGRHEGDQHRHHEPGDEDREHGACLNGPAHTASSSNRPGTGKRATMSATSSRMRSLTPASSRRSIASVISRAIARISAGPKPRVVVAGVPRRIPDAVLGGSASNGIAFLLTVIPTSSRRLSASLPVTPRGVTSTSMRWLSVPPDTTRAPRSAMASASSAAFSIVRCWSRRNGSSAASFSPTALAATTCISGPPWTPGKTVLSMRSPRV